MIILRKKMLKVFATQIVLLSLLETVTKTEARANCHLDDIKQTQGECLPIDECRPYLTGQLYAGNSNIVKRCRAGTKDGICCPTEPTLSQQKCLEYKEILKSPKSFGQPRFTTPHCAFRGSISFIVGGRKASEFEFPHAVGLGYGSNPDNLEFGCGATLISDSYLLTAAHCLNNQKKGKPKYAVIGDVTLKAPTSPYRKKVEIVEWIIHPDYAPPKIYNDIALLKLGEKLELSRFLLPACLGDPFVTPKKTGVVQAIGWGQTGYLEAQANHLQAVNLTVIQLDTCNKELGASDAASNLRYPQGFIKTQICAGDTVPDGAIGKDTCNGDSGGGIVVNPEVSCLFHVVGLTSIGSKHCGYGDPGVYTKVLSYVDWIERTVWK